MTSVYACVGVWVVIVCEYTSSVAEKCPYKGMWLGGDVQDGLRAPLVAVTY